MDFFRRTFNNIKLRLHISKVFQEASKYPVVLSPECLELAESYPAIVAAVIGDSLGKSSTLHVYGYLLLLEKLVNSCSSAFHSAMAQNCALQENLVLLATGRADGAERRRSRHLARLTLLEYSRMFADVPELRSLATLATAAEQRTGRHLLRAIVLENKSVRIIEPRPQDIVVFSPTESTAGSAVQTELPAVWPCSICTSMNRRSDESCLACGATRNKEDGALSFLKKSALSSGMGDHVGTCTESKSNAEMAGPAADG